MEAEEFPNAGINRKRKGTWLSKIAIEDCGAKFLTAPADQEYCCEIINLMHSEYPKAGHGNLLKDNTYFLDFDSIPLVDMRALERLIKKFKLIRNVTIEPVSAVTSEDGSPYYKIGIEVFYYSYSVNHLSVPMFSPFEVNEQIITPEIFAKTVSGDEHLWKSEWNSPYNMIREVTYALCNIEQFPPDIGVSLIYEEPVQGRHIFGIKILNFGTIPYSFIEYVNICVNSGYLYQFKFVADSVSKQNILTIKFLDKSREEDKQYMENLSGEWYYATMPKRQFSASFQDSATIKRRKFEDTPDKPETKKKSKWFLGGLFG